MVTGISVHAVCRSSTGVAEAARTGKLPMRAIATILIQNAHVPPVTVHLPLSDIFSYNAAHIADRANSPTICPVGLRKDVPKNGSGKTGKSVRSAVSDRT